MVEIVTDDALAQLNALSQTSCTIRGAVAYWCYPSERLSPSFLAALSKPNSYLCCDIHGPTSIEVLGEMRRKGAAVYLYLYQLVGRTEVEDSKGIPDHLMHSKVLIFEDGAGQCSIWIGSHNGTARALLGINHECAVVIKCEKGSATERSATAHLEAIRNQSTAFDLGDIEHYKALQGGLGAVGFIEAVDEQIQPLKSVTEVTFFGARTEDHKLLKNVGKKVYLAVTTRATGEETIYETDIRQTGELNSKSIEFSDRRFAYRHAQQIPVLQTHGAIPNEVYRNAKFFVTLRVGPPLSELFAVEAPPEEGAWRDFELDSYLALEKSERNPIDLPSGRSFRIQRAASRAEMTQSPLASLEWSRAYSVLSLEDKESMSRHPLVRKRIIKKRLELPVPKPSPSDEE